jgi:hypothetical protein
VQSCYFSYSLQDVVQDLFGGSTSKTGDYAAVLRVNTAVELRMHCPGGLCQTTLLSKFSPSSLGLHQLLSSHAVAYAEMPS